MLTNIIRGEYVTEVRYELAFDDGHGNGYGFPCDANGVVDEGLTPDALSNLEYCRQHPEAFKRANEVVEIRLQYKEEDRGTCRCGETVYLHDQYRAACQCPKCGRWYNLFGQELLPPEMWEEDY